MSTLRITFTGMCLYAPVGDTMHVLMPDHDGHDHSSGEHAHDSPSGWPSQLNRYTQAHAARLTFDIAHLKPGSDEEAKIAAHVSLYERRLEFTEHGSAFVPTMPDEVAHVGSGLKPGVLTGAQGKLASRVVLKRGQPVVRDPGVCWDWEGGRRQLTHQVEWVIEQFPDTLELGNLKGLWLGEYEPLPTLYPLKNGELRLWVWHIPVGEMPPLQVQPAPPPRTTPAPHFPLYAEFVENPSAETPKYVDAACQAAPMPRGDGSKGQYAYGCVSARVG